MKLFNCVARWRYKYDKKGWVQHIVIMAETKEEAEERFLNEVFHMESNFKYSINEVKDGIIDFFSRKM